MEKLQNWRIASIIYFINKMIHRSVRYCWVTTTKSVKFIFLSASLFFWRNSKSLLVISLTSKLLLFIFTQLYFSFYCSVLLFYFSNNFKLIDSLVSIGWWYTWFVTGSNIIWKYGYRGWLSIFSDSDETSSSATALNHFHIVHQSISSIYYLFFSFPLYFFIYQVDFYVL